MAKCLGCGQDLAYSKQRQCYNCRRTWIDKRKAAFERATNELGQINASNLKAIQKRVKELENTAAAKPTGRPETGRIRR